jgi:hypothetical protein
MPEKSASILTSPRPGAGALEARSSTVFGFVNQTERAGRSRTNVDGMTISQSDKLQFVDCFQSAL